MELASFLRYYAGKEQEKYPLPSHQTLFHLLLRIGNYFELSFVKRPFLAG